MANSRCGEIGCHAAILANGGFMEGMTGRSRPIPDCRAFNDGHRCIPQTAEVVCRSVRHYWLEALRTHLQRRLPPSNTIGLVQSCSLILRLGSIGAGLEVI